MSFQKMNNVNTNTSIFLVTKNQYNIRNYKILFNSQYPYDRTENVLKILFHVFIHILHHFEKLSLNKIYPVYKLFKNTVSKICTLMINTNKYYKLI